MSSDLQQALLALNEVELKSLFSLWRHAGDRYLAHWGLLAVADLFLWLADGAPGDPGGLLAALSGVELEALITSVKRDRGTATALDGEQMGFERRVYMSPDESPPRWEPRQRDVFNEVLILLVDERDRRVVPGAQKPID